MVVSVGVSVHVERGVMDSNTAVWQPFPGVLYGVAGARGRGLRRGAVYLCVKHAEMALTEPETVALDSE